MNVHEISKEELNRAETFNNRVEHTESILYLVKDFDTKEFLLFKQLKHFDKDKLHTLELLDNFNNELKEYNSLVLPKELISFENKAVGYTMDYIKNAIPVCKYFHRKDIDFGKKLHVMDLIISEVEKLHNIDGLKREFYLNDIHDGNFLYDEDFDKIFIVDIDSVKIYDNNPMSSKLLVRNDSIRTPYLRYKYRKNFMGKYLINENTDRYCYSIMLIELLSDTSPLYMSKKLLYAYLEDLYNEGYPSSLLDKLSKIYSIEDNKSLVGEIDKIPCKVRKDFTEFKKRIS